MKSIVSFGLLLVILSLGCGKNATTPSANKVEETPIAPAVVETPEEVLKGLSGTWTVVSIQNLPSSYSADYVKKLTARIEGNTIELSQPFGYFDRGEIRLDPAKSPKEFDVISLDKEGKPRTIKSSTTGGSKEERPVEPVTGIYRVDGEKLTIALTNRSNYRPKEFAISVMENTGTFVTVNKRASTNVIVLELTRSKR